MKKWIMGLGTCAALTLTAQPVFAQDAKIDWNGSFKARMWLTQNVNDRLSDSNDDAAFLDERVTLGATAELAENVKVVIQAAYFGTLGDGTGATGGDKADGGAAADLYLNKGYMSINGLFTDSLNVTIGRQGVSYGLKPAADGKFGNFRSSAYVLDSAHGNDAIQSFDGVVANWASGEDLMIDFYALTHDEGTPEPSSGGASVTPSDNWGSQGVHVAWQSDKLAIHGLVDIEQGLDMALIGSPPWDGNGSLTTISGGAVFNVSESFEIFGELVVQNGTLHFGGTDIDVAGNGLYLGANFGFGDGGAFVGGEFLMASGNDDDPDGIEELLLPWESRQPTKIVEGEAMADVTSNVQKIQVWGGTSFKVGEMDSSIKGTFATFNVADDGPVPANTGNGLQTTGGESALGTEIDVTWMLALTSDVDLSVTVATFAPGAAAEVGGEGDAINLILVETGADF